MINLSDLGLAPAISAATEQPAEKVTSTRGLEPGSVLARALYETWSGRHVVVVDSAPGAGKTTLLADMTAILLQRSDLNIAVVTPTRNGAVDVAGRIAQVIDDTCGVDDKTRPQVVLDVRNVANKPANVVPVATGRHVVVTTVASMAQRKTPEDEQSLYDLMIFDEAYQTTFADAAAAAGKAHSVFMVGDPGQIGPVVRSNTKVWEHSGLEPHRRAPEVFAKSEDAVILRLDATYRLGQQTTDIIAPLYGFKFDSRRPDRAIIGRRGQRLSEIRHTIIDPIETTAAMPLISRIMEAVESLLDGHSIEVEGVDEGELTAKDIAVVVAHNDQATAVSTELAERGHANVTVGTADSLQGGQWHAVVAVDPMIGHVRASTHQLAPGRLCVMASRHMSHLTWIHDGAWESPLAEVGTEEARVGIAVRRGLCEGRDV